MRLPHVSSHLARLRAMSPARRRLLAAAATILAAIALFGFGALAGHELSSSRVAASQASALARRNEALQNQLAILQRDRQVSQIADRVLQRNLADRDEEIRSLRADQAFYSKLVGADAQPGGLTVHGVAVAPIVHTHAWNFTVTLTHSAENAQPVQGRLTLAVEGVQGDKLATLAWNQLAGAAAGDGLPFAFKYFSQLHGTLMLPAGFTPNRVRVTVDPKSGAAVTRALAWSDALRGEGGGATP